MASHVVLNLDFLGKKCNIHILGIVGSIDKELKEYESGGYAMQYFTLIYIVTLICITTQ